MVDVAAAANDAVESVANKATDMGKQAAGGIFSSIASIPGKLFGGLWNTLGAAFNSALFVGAPLAALGAWVPQWPATVIGFFSKDAAEKYANMDVKDRVLTGLTVGAGAGAAPELLASVLPFAGNPLIKGVATIGSAMMATKVSIGAFGKDSGADPVRPNVPAVASNTAASQAQLS
jgi:hypothetical protein